MAREALFKPAENPPTLLPHLKEYQMFLMSMNYDDYGWFQQNKNIDTFQQIFINPYEQIFAIIEVSPMVGLSMSYGHINKQNEYEIVTNGIGVLAKSLRFTAQSHDLNDASHLLNKFLSIYSEPGQTIDFDPWFIGYQEKIQLLTHEINNNPDIQFSVFGRSMNQAQLINWMSNRQTDLSNSAPIDKAVKSQDSAYKQLIINYCDTNQITIPPGFYPCPADRFAVIKTDSSPEKLIAVTHSSKVELNNFLHKRYLSQATPDEVDIYPVKILDAKTGEVFALTEKGKLDLINTVILNTNNDENTSTITTDTTMPDIQQLERQLSSTLASNKKKIYATQQTFIKIKPSPATSPLKPWNSNYFGLAYQPPGFEYPSDSNGTPLIFLAQINFSEVPEMAGFPNKGILQFFIGNDDLWGQEFSEPYNSKKQFQLQTSQNNFRVIYYPDILEDEKQLGRIFHKVEYAPIEETCQLTFSLAHEYLPRWDYRFDQVMGKDFFKQFGDAEGEIEGEYCELFQSGGNKISGYPSFCQDDVRNIVPTDEKWLLLLQIDEAEDVDIMWGDGGVGNFFIEENALKALDFSKVLYNWDCH